MKTLKSIAIALMLTLGLTQTASAASLSLDPAKATFNPDCHSVVHVYLHTEGEESNAVDAFLRFDEDQLRFKDQIDNKEGIQTFPTGLYEAYPGNEVEDGAIRITGFNDKDFFLGEGHFASLVFKPKRGVEEAQISFEFIEDETRDSNVADINSLDVLRAVKNGEYKFAENGECGDEVYPSLVDGVFQSAEGLFGAARSPIWTWFWILLLLSLIGNFFFLFGKHFVSINFDVRKIRKTRKTAKKKKK